MNRNTGAHHYHRLHQQQQQQQRPKQSSWFQGAPLSKFVAISTVVSHVLLTKGGFPTKTQSIALTLDSMDDLIENGAWTQLHRLFTHSLTFETMGELITGLACFLPLMIQFERQLGTTKLASFLFIKCWCIATLTSILVLSTFILDMDYYAPGPYAYMGSLLFLYHKYTPRLHIKFIGILGFDFSEKAMTYFFHIIMMNNQGIKSIVPFICGIISSYISSSQNNMYGKWECHVPNFINTIAKYVAQIMGLDQVVTSYIYMSQNVIATAATNAAANIQTHSRIRNRGDGLGGGLGGGGLAAGGNANGNGLGGEMQIPQQQPQFQPMPVPDPPSPEKIELLTAMGFQSDAVIRALNATDNNVEAAANRLLTGM